MTTESGEKLLSQEFVSGPTFLEGLREKGRR